MLAFKQVEVASANFPYTASLAVLAFAYLGGITSINGAVVGGMLVAGSLAPVTSNYFYASTHRALPRHHRRPRHDPDGDHPPRGHRPVHAADVPLRRQLAGLGDPRRADAGRRLRRPAPPAAQRRVHASCSSASRSGCTTARQHDHRQQPGVGADQRRAGLAGAARRGQPARPDQPDVRRGRAALGLGASSASGRPRSSATSSAGSCSRCATTATTSCTCRSIFAGVALMVRSIVLRIYRAKTGQVRPDARRPPRPTCRSTNRPSASSTSRRWSDVALLETRGLTVTLRRPARQRGHRPRRRAGQARRADRPQRRRQDDVHRRHHRLHPRQRRHA